MPLEREPHVPDTYAAEVQGLDGTRALVVMTDPADRVAVWVLSSDMAAVQLDAAGVQALRALLADAEARMAKG